MKFLADECVYLVTVLALRKLGHAVITAHEAGLDGQPDEQILEYAQKENRILLTADLDFSNIRRYPPKSYCGIIVLKIRPHNAHEVHTTLRHFLATASEASVWKTLVIVDRNKYRVR